MLARISIALWAAIGAASAQSTLVISPALLTECNERGLATARLTWRTQEPTVQVRIGSAIGPAMTAFEPGIGGASTGDWVTEGLVFVLVNASGQEVARTTASVRCLETSPHLVEQLATQSYLPLEVGNRWVYRYSNRVVTANHLVRWVDRKEEIGGETWFVLKDQVVPSAPASETLYRTDSAGRIYRRRASGAELFLDPNVNGDPGAVAIIQQRNLTATTAFGSFPNALSYVATVDGLILQRGTLARGIGLVSMDENLQTGSSGGFTNGLELTEAVIAGKVYFRSPSNGLELAPEAQVLDVVGRRARNCALPCYFTACGLGGGQPDPPGTYKPCMFTRLKVENPAARSVSLELVNAANESVYTVSRPLESSTQEQLWFETIPLYRTSGVSLPLGAYQLKATVKSEAGETLNTGSAVLRID